MDFEKSIGRIEEILENINSGKLTLEDSLKLFEEANGLITKCSKELTEAEQKVEILIKNRTNDLVLDENQKPLTEDFVHTKASVFK